MQGSVAHGGDTLEDLAGTYDGVHACVVTFVCVRVTHNTHTPTHKQLPNSSAFSLLLPHLPVQAS